MFSRILIANRGEIALRVIRTCRRLGIETVAVYSEADRDAVYLKLADEAYCIGPPEVAKSYLRMENIIAAAEVADVEAIHPGYGFLAENRRFADVCRSCQITFIGPPVEAMEVFGDKVKAKAVARKAGVPAVPGSDGPVGDDKEAIEVAHRIGYPVLLKAAAGGGGRGMRAVHNDATLLSAIGAARAEAQIAFGEPAVYIEKLIEHAHHVEIQALADEHGHCIHLGERDCSIQRRHQKLSEESPSPIISKKRREEMGRASIRLLKEAGYTNAGTVEFVVDEDGNYFFIEVNARIQVEHCVTEMVTGLDLVEEQLRIASGEPLRYRQKDVAFKGHAIECRINAEDPDAGFAPRPGRVSIFFPPQGRGIRVDSHVYSGYMVPPQYDSLLGKLVVLGSDRDDAIHRTRQALDDFVLEGVPSTIHFQKRVLEHELFLKGKHYTKFVDEELTE
ncbi:MAG: acetyl-CoA carboxylase biotin carboxylase subunit [Planctomycetota bacterium]|jgi:acetyl-CoA carboxylase biotin carboxylase subunit